MKAVLIANRGEIAVRVARAARDHGIKSIAIYSDEDRTALHVATADEAYALNGLSAAETYLDQRKIIEIAKKLPEIEFYMAGGGDLLEKVKKQSHMLVKNQLLKTKRLYGIELKCMTK